VVASEVERGAEDGEAQMAVHLLRASQRFGGLETLMESADRLAAAALPFGPVHRAARVGEAKLRSPPLANELLEHDDAVAILMSLDVHVPTCSKGSLNCIRQVEAGSIALRKKVA